MVAGGSIAGDARRLLAGRISLRVRPRTREIMDPSRTIWVPLNGMITREIYLMFEKKSSVVASAARELVIHSLYGGIGYAWAGDKATTHEFDESDMEWVTDLIRTAIHWKLMFGLCPYYVSTTDDGRPSIRVSEIGEGHFLARKGPKRETEVGWLSDEGRMRGATEPDTKVYIWPDHTPDLWAPYLPFRSIGARLLKGFMVVEELGRNALVADWTSARPPVITQHAARPDNDDRSETQVFADVLAMGHTVQSTGNQESYRINRETQAQQLAHTEAVNRAIMIGASQGMSPGGVLTNQARLNPYQQGLFSLPVGQIPSHYQMPQPRQDYLNWVSGWKETVHREIGVPLEGGATSSSLQRTRSGAPARYSASEASILEDTVKATRVDMGRFFETTFRIFRSEYQTSQLSSQIHTAEKEQGKLEKLRSRFEDHFYGRTNKEIAADPPPDSAGRARRAGVLNKNVAKALSMGRAEVDVLDPKTLDVLLGKKDTHLTTHLGRLRDMITSRTHLHLVWKEALILNWEFLFKVHEIGLLPDNEVKRMVCAKLGLPYETCAASSSERPKKKQKTQRTDPSQDKGQKSNNTTKKNAAGETKKTTKKD